MPIYEEIEIEVPPPKKPNSALALIKVFFWCVLVTLTLKFFGLFFEWMNAPWIGG